MNRLPALTAARAPLTRVIETLNELGQRREIAIPAERALTLYVDQRELVTLMTLGAAPELLVLGYLRNQHLVDSPAEVESITVDWDVGAAAVRTRAGITGIEQRTASKVVTTGCGQGSMFGALMDKVDLLRLPEARIGQADLHAITETMRLQASTYKQAGSVHGCALFQGQQMLMFVEDVGRHNAMDTIAGWVWMNRDRLDAAAPKVFYTTGRLTSEMIIKSAQLGVAIVVSRSGITQMGHDVATSLGMCTIGRALNRRFLCYSGAARLELEAATAQSALRVVA